MRGVEIDTRTSKDKVLELQGLRPEIEDRLTQALLVKAMNSNEDYDTVGWEYELRAERIQQELDELDKKINMFKWHARPPSQKKSSFNVDDIKANIKIETLLGKPNKQSGRRAYYNCPFHDDNTPSFVVYEEQNTFHCFSCGAGGDIIALHMKMKEIDFVTACKDLNSCG